MPRLIRIVAAAFTVFIAVTVYAANTGLDHPGMALVRWLPYGDKIGHLTLWGLLTLLVNLAIPGRAVSVGRLRIPVGSVVLTAVVVAEEASQRWLDNRTLDPLDLAANLIGITLATVVGYILIDRRSGASASRRRKTPHSAPLTEG